jgi:lipopolysaccharide transport system ATP-binding protein
MDNRNIIYGKYTYGEVKAWTEKVHSKFICGKFCSIGPEVIVFLGGNHRTDWVTTYPFGHVNKNIFNNRTSMF